MHTFLLLRTPRNLAALAALVLVLFDSSRSANAFLPLSRSFTSSSFSTTTTTTTTTSTMTKSMVVSQLGMTSEPSSTTGSGDGEEDTTKWKPEVFTNPHDELMYALGINLGRQLGDVRPLVMNGEELAQVAKGLLDAVVGRLDDNGQRGILKKRGKELDSLILQRADSLRQKLELAGTEMLQQMMETEGAKTLPSGVVVHVLEHGPSGPGKGVRPTPKSVVEIHYHGTLPDGTIFDSTMGADKPVQLPLDQVIPGWRDGVLTMHEGESVMMGIPPDLAYGSKGTPDGSIPGGATLFFKVQLIKVVSGGVGGEPSLLGVDGKPLTSSGGSGSGLLGADGKPLF